MKMSMGALRGTRSSSPMHRVQRQFVQKAFAEYSTGKPNVPVSADPSIDVDKSAGTFTITAKNLKGFEELQRDQDPFWSHAKGMDDIKLVYHPSSSIRWLL